MNGRGKSLLVTAELNARYGTARAVERLVRFSLPKEEEEFFVQWFAQGRCRTTGRSLPER